MSRFIESIKCEDGKLCNIHYHNARYNLTLKVNYKIDSATDFCKIIDVPAKCTEGLFKCRVVYSEKITKVEFLPYQYRKINSLKLVKDNNIEYSFKYSNRNMLNSLFNKRCNCDDILIVKNGCIADSYSANVVFFDGQKWWTPDTPLLQGTQRAFLIETEKIFITRITPEDIDTFECAGLINAMQGLDKMSKIPVSKISGFE